MTALDLARKGAFVPAVYCTKCRHIHSTFGPRQKIDIHMPNMERIRTYCWENHTTGRWSIHNLSLEPLCPGCGVNAVDNHQEEPATWVSTSVWYKPWTWGCGVWILQSDFCALREANREFTQLAPFR